MKKYLVGAAVAAGSFIPFVTMAAYGPVSVTTNNLNNSIINITNTINLIVPLMLAVAVIFFIYGVIKYIIAAGPEEASKGKSMILWSIIGLASILAVWGLARLLINFFGLTPTSLDSGLLPSVPTGINPSTTPGLYPTN